VDCSVGWHASDLLLGDRYVVEPEPGRVAILIFSAEFGRSSVFPVAAGLAEQPEYPAMGTSPKKRAVICALQRKREKRSVK
jgi:hypothetical protein